MSVIFGMTKAEYEHTHSALVVCKVVNKDYYYIGLTYNPEQTAQRLESGTQYFPFEATVSCTVNVFSVCRPRTVAVEDVLDKIHSKYKKLGYWLGKSKWYKLPKHEATLLQRLITTLNHK